MNLNTVFLYRLVLLNAVLFTVNAVISTNATFQGYRKWTPVNSTRNDMYCPEYCYNNPEEDERCCCCSAVTCWELDTSACNVTVGQLYIEYKDIYGSAIFVPSGNHTLYEVTHRNGRLTKFPDNLCDFSDSLVKLDLSYNKIENISDIRCLNKLDTLRLDANKITTISNDTFSDMEYLRVVSLSRNNIETLQPNTIQKKNGNILMMDFSYNIVESIDVTNIIRPGPFCNMSCEGCEVIEQTNLLNYVIGENNIHGPGYINLRNTSGRTFLNFTTLGVHDYTMLGKYFLGRFDFEGSSIDCDCQIYPFFNSLGQDASKYWHRLDAGDVICMSPDNMKGRNLTYMYLTQTFEDLICDIPDCPRNCKCTDKPSDNVVNVKCKGITSMPDFSPIGYWNNNRINLDLSDPSNKISHFPNKGYMDRLVNVNISGSKVQTLDVNALENLPSHVIIDMSDQNLKTLPVSFSKLNPNRIKFGSHPVECNCENTWIGDWIRYNRAHGSVLCATDKGVVPAELVSSDYLECPVIVDNTFLVYLIIPLCLLIVSIFATYLLNYLFKYEIMLLKRKYVNKKAKSGEYQFDAMLTFSEENPDVFRWIEREIVPALKREGYWLFVPFYDIMFGGLRENEIAEGASKSRNYVVFLCNKYLCDENSVQEFEILWKHFCMDTKKNVIVVNFDNFDSSEISVRRLRAFRRIRDDINFIERESKLFERLKQRLGPPGKYADNCSRLVTGDDIVDDSYEESDPDSASGNEISDNASDKNKNEAGDGSKDAEEEGVAKDGLLDGKGKQTRKMKAKKKTWYKRLAVRNTTCNCTYRKCYLHAEDAYHADAENDWLRKRTQSAQNRQKKQLAFNENLKSRPKSVISTRPTSSMSEVDQNNIGCQLND